MSIQTKLSPAEWRQHIEAQLGSGLSQESYCREQGLSVHSFRDHKYRQRDRSLPNPTGSNDAWLELPSALGNGHSPGWQIELDLGNGLCLRLRQG